MKEIDSCAKQQKRVKTKKLSEDKLISLLTAEKPITEELLNFKKYSCTMCSWLLSKYPQFADKCERWNEFDGDDWWYLLAAQPHFADKCDKWHEFDKNGWVELITVQPQFADKCDKWHEFVANDWKQILSKQPQFADQYDFNNFKSHHWAAVLMQQPQLIKKCDVSKLYRNDVIRLLKVQHHLAEYFPVDKI